MPIFNPLLEFSHAHCVAICAFLVPANLLATLQTMVLITVPRPWLPIRWAIALASVLALAMVLHVLSWFAVGVVMAPTFILLFLAGVCLSINGAIAGYLLYLQRRWVYRPD